MVLSALRSISKDKEEATDCRCVTVGSMLLPHCGSCEALQKKETGKQCRPNDCTLGSVFILNKQLELQLFD